MVNFVYGAVNQLEQKGSALWSTAKNMKAALDIFIELTRNPKGRLLTVLRIANFLAVEPPSENQKIYLSEANYYAAIDLYRTAKKMQFSISPADSLAALLRAYFLMANRMGHNWTDTVILFADIAELFGVPDMSEIVN